MRGSESKRESRYYHGKPATKRPMWSLVGCLVRLTCKIRTRYAVVGPETLLRVTYSGGVGFVVESDAPCQCCGVKIVITKMRPEEVQIVREPEGDPGGAR